jgi:hypothetical protein
MAGSLLTAHGMALDQWNCQRRGPDYRNGPLEMVIEIEPGRWRRTAATRLLAIRRAERAIEEAIKVKRTKSPPTQ